VFAALVRGTVKHLEAAVMDEFGVDDRRRARQRGQFSGEPWEAAGPVGTVARVEDDVLVRLVDLHPVAVELDLVEPALALGKAVAQAWEAGRDEGGTRHGHVVARWRRANNERKCRFPKTTPV